MAADGGGIGRRFRARSEQRLSRRYVLLVLASGIVSLVAMGLPWSPASCRIVPLAGSWHPLVFGPWLTAALASGLLLRVPLVENPRVSPWLAGALHALVSAVLFTFLSVFLDGVLNPHVGFEVALKEGLLTTAYGLVVVGMSAHVAVPVGMLFVRRVRAGAAIADTPR